MNLEGRFSQVAKVHLAAGVRCEALECGSSLPLSSARACSRELRPGAQFPASKLARDKAAASCRTPKLRSVFPHKVYGANNQEGLVTPGESPALPNPW